MEGTAGAVSIPIDDPPTSVWGPAVEHTISPSVTLAMRLVRADALAGSRTLFVIRHAESRWNSGNVVAKLAQIDHGLTPRGVAQARALSSAMRDARRPRADLEASFLAASSFVASPMKRAVQTALLSLSAHPRIADAGLTLLPVLREVRGTLGSRDCCTTSRGACIKDTALADLLATSSSSDQDSQQATSGDSEASNTAASSIDVDATRASDVWWSRSPESNGDARKRIGDFLLDLNCMEQRTCIAVTHSNFLRHLFRAHCSREHCRSFRTRKVANCAVVAIALDFSQPQGSLIEDAQFIFGSGFR